MSGAYRKIAERVTERILEFLKQGTIPWQKPWKGGKFNAPRSASTGKIYRGTNLALLGCCDYESPWWMTFAQAKKLAFENAVKSGRKVVEKDRKNRKGFYYWDEDKNELFQGGVMSGEKSMPVHYWKFGDPVPCSGNPWSVTSTKCSGDDCNYCKGTGLMKPAPQLYSFNVFNANQCEGLPEKYYPSIENDKDAREFKPIEKCEEIVANYQDAPTISHDQPNSCHYVPIRDSVHMVKPEKFVSDEEYYSTLFHELIHSTGHKNRLNREGVTNFDKFGSHKYSREELIAEMGSTYLCGISGIDRSSVIKNSASYIQGWMKKLDSNKDWIVWAGGRSAKACDHILGETA